MHLVAISQIVLSSKFPKFEHSYLSSNFRAVSFVLCKILILLSYFLVNKEKDKMIFYFGKKVQIQVPKFHIFGRYTDFFCSQFLYFSLDLLHSDLAVLCTYFLILLQFLRGTRDQLKGPKSTKFKNLNFLIFHLILISFFGKMFISLRYSVMS